MDSLSLLCTADCMHISIRSPCRRGCSGHRFRYLSRSEYAEFRVNAISNQSTLMLACEKLRVLLPLLSSISYAIEAIQKSMPCQYGVCHRQRDEFQREWNRYLRVHLLTTSQIAVNQHETWRIYALERMCELILQAHRTRYSKKSDLRVLQLNGVFAKMFPVFNSKLVPDTIRKSFQIQRVHSMHSNVQTS